MLDRRRTLAAALAGLGLIPAAPAGDYKPLHRPTSAVTTPSAPMVASPVMSSAPATGPAVMVDANAVADAVHPDFREAVSRVVRQPTITAKAAGDDVTGPAERYSWLLDHPDRVSLAWRRLRVPCVEIADAGEGRFLWTDPNGSEVVWQAVGRSATGLVWYATGKVKPSPVLPTVPVRAVAVVAHPSAPAAAGGTVIRPTAQVFLQTDSRAANLAMRMLGPTAPRVAEQSVEQLLYFYGAMADHAAKHPEQVDKLFAPAKR